MSIEYLEKKNKVLKEILWNLECAEVNLQDDIQALAYIQDTCRLRKGKIFY